VKKEKLLKKIKHISNKNFKLLAPKIDRVKKFPKEITKLLNKEDLNFLLGYHAGKKISLNAKQECQFYFYATKYCANIRNYFLVSLGMVGSTIIKYGTPIQKKNFLNNTIKKGAIYSLVITEPNAGSNTKEISTKYIKTKNGYLINGKKKWITLGGISKTLLVLANGKQGLLLFIIDSKTKGIKRSEIKNILTNRGSHISNISFNKVRVSASSLIGGKIEISDKALDYALKNGRAIASISAFSMCSAALEETIDYTKKREQFGKKIWNYQLIQKIIADARVNISAGLALTENAFQNKRGMSVKSMNYCNISKLYASQNVQKICSDLLDVYGANGTSGKYNIERYFRESKGFQFIEGTSQILTQLIALNSIIGFKE
jgi:alkylation response protein AidB-like acyl-CoA dehydrogenase